MNDITKATCKRLNKYSNIPCISVIGELLYNADMLCYDISTHKYEAPDDLLKQYYGFRWIGDYALSEARGEYAKKHCRGLASRYPDYIECSFTHGLTQVLLKKDANQFVRLIVADIESGRI